MFKGENIFSETRPKSERERLDELRAWYRSFAFTMQVKLDNAGQHGEALTDEEVTKLEERYLERNARPS